MTFHKGSKKYVCGVKEKVGLSWDNILLILDLIPSPLTQGHLKDAPQIVFDTPGKNVQDV